MCLYSTISHLHLTVVYEYLNCLCPRNNTLEQMGAVAWRYITQTYTHIEKSGGERIDLASGECRLGRFKHC
jgi:hypothetical protein